MSDITILCKSYRGDLARAEQLTLYRRLLELIE